MQVDVSFAARLRDIFLTELRRQSVVDWEAWAERLDVYSSYVPTATSSAVQATGHAASSSTSVGKRGTVDEESRATLYALVIDMTNVPVGEKPCVALCESLLKMEGPALRGLHSDVTEWQILWRRCGLTDRVVPHLQLLLQGCPKLSFLDLSVNVFSPQCQSSLLQVAAEVPCDVVLAEDARFTRNGSQVREHSVPASTRSLSPRLETHRQERETSRPRQVGSADKTGLRPPGCSAQEEGSAGSLRASVSPESPGPTVGGMPAAVRTATLTAPSAPSRSYRSPSLVGTSSSLAPSQRNYAGGSAEALRRRREELFGTAAAAKCPPEPGEGNAGGREGVREASPDTKATPVSAARTPPAADAPVGQPQRVPLSEDNDNTPFISTLKKHLAGTSKPAEVVARDGTRRERNSVRCGRGGGAGTAAAAAAAAKREPFVDDNDRLDVTANLSPVLDSVLDLSAIMTRDGALRQGHTFGDARDVWDLLGAYQKVSAQQQQLSGSFRPESDAVLMDASTPTALPAALLGSAPYSVITVLNLSHNHLTALCPLPATLLRLDVSSNELTQLSGLEGCTMLSVLNARRNQLRVIGGLEKNACMAHLFLGHNDIAVIEGVAHMVLLETLDVSFNGLRAMASLRALSLCSALRHLLLRGNPITEARKPGFMAMLRNLCPTLVMVDEQRMAGMRLAADRALALRNGLRQPNHFDAAQSNARGDGACTHLTLSLSAASMATTSPPASFAVDTALHSGGTSAEGSSLKSSVAFTASRRRDACLPAPFAVDHGKGVDERSLNLLQLLTRGVSAPTGYGDAANTRHAAQRIAEKAKDAAKVQEDRKRQLSVHRRPLRSAVVQHLAEESLRYLEETIVRRMTSQPQQHQQQFDLKEKKRTESTATAASPASTTSARQRTSSRDSPGRNAYGGMAHPERVENALADVLGCSANAPEPKLASTAEAEARAKAEVELLKRYQPHTANICRGPSGSASRTRSLPAKPHSIRPATVRGSPRQRGPAGAARYPTEGGDKGDNVLGGQQQQRRRTNDTPPRPHPSEEQEDERKRGGDAGGSYTTQSVVDRHPRDTVDIECSPISKDPNARLVPSLNTTTTGLEYTGVLREVPSRAPQRQRLRHPADAELTAVYEKSRSRSRPVVGEDLRGGDTAVTVPPDGVPQRVGVTRSTSPTTAAARVSRKGSARSSSDRDAERAVAAAAPVPPKDLPRQPLHADGPHRARVSVWTRQLKEDAKALQDALQTIVSLLEAQRQPDLPVPESSRELPPTFLEERRRCLRIVQNSGMLLDTHVPMEVVMCYGFSKAELEGEEGASSPALAGSRSSEGDERAEVLRQVLLLGDAKTCLRYVALLIGDGRERLLQQYVDQLKESLRHV